MIKKVVIIGPESTGKSTLCEQLAAHYNASWVPEFARQYLEKNGMNYSFEDLFEIAKGQLQREQLAVDSNESLVISHESLSLATGNSQPLTRNSQPLFIDTNLYVIKVWSEIAFNKCDNRILTQIAKRSYDLYLLCNTDLPWVEDSLREYPELKTREKIYHYYKDAMINQQTAWADISGNYEERLQKAISAVDKIL